MTFVTFTFRPLDLSTWVSDGKTQYENCRFRAPWSNTLRLLDDELRRICVTKAIIEMELSESQIRLDGLPRGDATPRGPRVRLSFTLPGVGPVQYPCDTYDRWHDNMRAIAMTLRAQRAMDRYGATRHQQQYRGWAQLPRSIEVAFTVESAAGFIGEMVARPAALIVRDAAVFRESYRAAAMRAHPDRGGSEILFRRLQDAKRVLDQHHATATAGASH